MKCKYIMSFTYLKVHKKWSSFIEVIFENEKERRNLFLVMVTEQMLLKEVYWSRLNVTFHIYFILRLFFLQQ